VEYALSVGFAYADDKMSRGVSILVFVEYALKELYNKTFGFQCIKSI
jgi:hypothetical protein